MNGGKINRTVTAGARPPRRGNLRTRHGSQTRGRYGVSKTVRRFENGTAFRKRYGGPGGQQNRSTPTRRTSAVAVPHRRPAREFHADFRNLRNFQRQQNEQIHTITHASRLGRRLMVLSGWRCPHASRVNSSGTMSSKRWPRIRRRSSQSRPPANIESDHDHLPWDRLSSMNFLGNRCKRRLQRGNQIVWRIQTPTKFTVSSNGISGSTQLFGFPHRFQMIFEFGR